MAKRYHEPKMRKHGRAGSGYYEGADERREQERADFSMISEDRSAVANLPQMVKYHDWPRAGHYARYELDDTIKGIDHQESEDGSQMMKHLQPGKY